MARSLQRLSAKTVAAKRAQGYYADGGNLWLQVSATGTKSWVFRYELRHKRREMGLGATHTTSLAEARAAATDYRKLLLSGLDPIEERNQGRIAHALQAASNKTFDECAAAFIKAHRVNWTNPKHVEQWETTIATYCSPIMGSTPVGQIDTGLVIRVLEPIWISKRETAGRLRGRMERIFSWAKVHQYRSGDNPAVWRGHLDQLLPSQKRSRKIKHYPALPYLQVPEFLQELRAVQDDSARALELIILTIARTEEAVASKLTEINYESRNWTVPPERMKGRRAHIVPLSVPAVALLSSLPRADGDVYIFPGRKPGTHMSNAAMLELLKRMDPKGEKWIDPKDGRRAVPHGFRSSFRDWSAERTSYPREVCEMALAHAIDDKTEAAYRRGELLEKRRRLMNEWARFCESPTRARVTAINAKTQQV